MPSDAAIRRIREQLDADESVEATFRRLRADGHSRREAVQILLGVLDLPLAEAKRVLAACDTWGEAWDRANPDDSSPSVPPAPG
jgi:hypothetical protein